MTTAVDGATLATDVRALQVKVGGIDADISQINDRILGLDGKIEKMGSALGTEFRSALSSLGTQLGERNRTPWGILISAAGLITTTLAFVGSQALSPIQADIKTLKEHLVPREEINYRAATDEKRMERLEGLEMLLVNRRYDEMQKLIDRLERQNDGLRGLPSSVVAK
ncbi:hypothetical protein HAP48_0042325 [Bradyrhizobium septentrionale]|uniref:Uncharacterized protein n=1 Tax=Bradyrhizobium septentrionale TaxID=1404411 RepID=A0A974A360_9BRAD|nr:hypothetical protein [Bradyrhizobium septentrionale]UGY15095.1 hypothetical protein HAP48_0042325 [Bradyrhizobium septentrionale]